MNENKVHFKQALKKQIWTIVIVIVIVLTDPMITGGLKTDLEFYTWIFLTLASSYLVFIMLKKQSKEALCPHSKKLSIIHPKMKNPLKFEVDAPRDFYSLLT